MRLSRCLLNELQGTADRAENKDEIKNKIEKLKAKAIEFQEWEALRDLDLFSAQILQDQNIFERCYYLTPFKDYRNYLQRHAGLFGFTISDSPTIQTSDRSSTARRLSLENFKLGNENRPGPNLAFRVFLALIEDGYRPLRTPELFRLLYPTEHYDPISSSRRVQQAIRRFESAVKAKKIPLVLSRLDSGYRIDWRASKLNLHFPKAWRNIELNHREYFAENLKLNQSHPNQHFSASQAAKTLQKPLRSTQTLLKKLQELKLLEKLGRGPNTKYQCRPNP